MPQNQVMGIITEAVRTVRIQELEMMSDLRAVEDIKDSRAQKQAEKFMRLESHSVHKRMKVIERGRPKQTALVEIAIAVMREHQTCSEAIFRLLSSSSTCQVQV